MKRKNILIAISVTVVVLSGIILVGTSGIRQEPAFATLEDLPKDVVYIKHPYEEEQAEEMGKILMRHYGTPEAMGQGGPVYGAMGYRIVSIEYEIPVNAIPEKTVGQTFPGYLLALKQDMLPQLGYDHFHISYQQSGHLYNIDTNMSLQEHAISKNESEAGVYSIHFMLIPHTEELRYGLVCE